MPIPSPPISGGDNRMPDMGDGYRPPVSSNQEQRIPPTPSGSSGINDSLQSPTERYPTGHASGDRSPNSFVTANLGAGLDPQGISPLDNEEEHLEATPIDHHAALKEFLEAYPRCEKRSQPPPEKLARLSLIQFKNLSTDVFDEALRRLSSDSVSSGNSPPPFLLPRSSFQPTRNQARLKLSTLKRFQDLVEDVYSELERRFPMLVEDNGWDFGDDETLVGGGDD
jgi:Spa2 homology domain (SHD) of GIT